MHAIAYSVDKVKQTIKSTYRIIGLLALNRIKDIVSHFCTNTVVMKKL